MPAEMCSFYSCDWRCTVINHLQFYLGLQFSASRSLSLTFAHTSRCDRLIRKGVAFRMVAMIGRGQ